VLDLEADPRKGGTSPSTSRFCRTGSMKISGPRHEAIATILSSRPPCKLACQFQTVGSLGSMIGIGLVSPG